MNQAVLDVAVVLKWFPSDTSPSRIANSEPTMRRVVCSSSCLLLCRGAARSASSRATAVWTGTWPVAPSPACKGGKDTFFQDAWEVGGDGTAGITWDHHNPLTPPIYLVDARSITSSSESRDCLSATRVLRRRSARLTVGAKRSAVENPF